MFDGGRVKGKLGFWVQVEGILSRLRGGGKDNGRKDNVYHEETVVRTCGNWLSPSTAWVSKIKFRTSGLEGLGISIR